MLFREVAIVEKGNHRKGDRTPAEARMPLRVYPFAPTRAQLASAAEARVGVPALRRGDLEGWRNGLRGNRRLVKASSAESELSLVYVIWYFGPKKGYK